jgi:RNA polymerase sigma factor (sigma-70 family)
VKERSELIEEALGRLKVDPYEERAWGSLYDNVVPRARAMAFRILSGDATGAQDAVHNALVRLMEYTSFERFGSADEFLRYFTTMVHHAALDLRRRQRSSPSVDPTTTADDSGSADLDSEVQASSLDQGNNPETTLAFKRAVESLGKALTQRELLVCTLLADGYERKELSARLGMSDSTTAVVVHRLREKLRGLGYQARGFS